MKNNVGRQGIQQHPVLFISFFFGVYCWVSISYADVDQTEVGTQESSSVESVESTAPPVALSPEEEAAKTIYHGAVEEYKKSIIAIEDHHGVYDDQLVDQLLGLGVTHFKQGENRSAIPLFKRAIHVSRINHGLHSLHQEPILEHLVASYASANDWNSANEKQQLLYDLRLRNHGPDSPELLPALAEMADWHLAAYERGSNLTHLLRATEMNRHAIAIIEANFGVLDARLTPALLRQVSTSYLLGEYQTSVVSSPNSMLASQQSRLDFTQPEIAEQDQRYLAMLNPYRDGKSALVQRIKMMRERQAEPQELAQALVDLGDWYFLFNKRESAARSYQKAEKLLVELEGSEELISYLFGKPHALSFRPKGLTPEQKAEQGKNQEGFVEAKFDITASGRARDVEIVESNPPGLMDAIVQQSIKSTRYRPRIIDGRPVLTKGLVYRHVFNF